MFLPEMLEIIQNKKGACKRIRRRAFPGFLFRLTKRFVSEQSPDKINEGDRRPSSESVWPAPRPRPTPEDAGWSLSTGRGGLWLRTRELTCLSLKKQAAVLPNLVALSLHGFLQPFDSELEISITIQTTLWDSLIHLSKGLRCVTLPNSRASSRGGLHKVRSTYYSSSSLSLSPALILQGWLAVYPANPCGMWFALGRRAGGRVRSTGTAQSSEGALLPAGAGAVVLNRPYPLCKPASLIPNYLAVCAA